MGLDIVNIERIGFEDDLLDKLREYIKEEYIQLYEKCIEEDEFESIYDLISIEHFLDEVVNGHKRDSEEDILKQIEIEFKEEIKYLIERAKVTKRININDLDIALANEYEWICDNEEVSGSSRMGSYGTIHYGRRLASSLELFYQEKGTDLSFEVQPERMTKEKVVELIASSEDNRHMYAEELFFKNLCQHSDCEGYYIPMQEQIDIDNGSSILLLKELDILWKTGTIEIMESIAADIELEYGSSDDINNHAPNEISKLYNVNDICLWVFRKMLYHSVCSVLFEEIVVFC